MYCPPVLCTSLLILFTRILYSNQINFSDWGVPTLILEGWYFWDGYFLLFFFLAKTLFLFIAVC